MSPKTAPAGNESLFSAPVKKGLTPNNGLNPELQELYGLGMDRALGIQKVSFEAAVRLQSDAIQSYQDAVLLTPALNNLFENMAQALSAIMKLQMKCLSLMAPGLAASVPAVEVQHPAEVLEHSMEIASGQKKRTSAAKHVKATS